MPGAAAAQEAVSTLARGDYRHSPVVEFFIRSTKLVLTERPPGPRQHAHREELLVRVNAGRDDARQIIVAALIRRCSAVPGVLTAI